MSVIAFAAPAFGNAEALAEVAPADQVNRGEVFMAGFIR